MNSSHEKAEGLEEKEESERRGEAARQDGGGIRLVEATPCGTKTLQQVVTLMIGGFMYKHT